ncbi:MAG: hypothetical protein ILA34_04020 [Bacteroidaceae bacterium]|nr:hypothetical protein [Bacteroidaceae bacterium]
MILSFICPFSLKKQHRFHDEKRSFLPFRLPPGLNLPHVADKKRFSASRKPPSGKALPLGTPATLRPRHGTVPTRPDGFRKAQKHHQQGARDGPTGRKKFHTRRKRRTLRRDVPIYLYLYVFQ